MKRLLLLSSLVFLATIQSCKVKKGETQQHPQSSNLNSDQGEAVLDTDNENVIHAPGVVNPKQLDSLKSEYRKQKRIQE